LSPTAGRLARADRVVVGRDRRIEAAGGAERDREDRPEAVDRVEGEQHRDVQPRLLDGEVLEVVDPRGIRDAEGRAEALLHLVIGDQEVREQLDLLQLLLERHAREQVVHARLDSPVSRRAGGCERVLIARPRCREYPSGGQRAERHDRNGDRSPAAQPEHSPTPNDDPGSPKGAPSGAEGLTRVCDD
jgi:hypothetical protein